MQQDKAYFRKRNYVKKRIGELVPGDILLHPIFRSDGLMLINKNKVLNVFLIDKIKKQVRYSASVLVASSPKEFESFLSDAYNSIGFRQDLRQLMKEYGDHDGIRFQKIDFNEIETKSPFLSALSSSPYWISLENSLESEHLKKRASFIKEELLALFRNDQKFIDLCSKINGYDDIILIHTINTVCISLIFGLILELTDEELIDLSVAALFVHVGYTVLPKDEFKSFLKSQNFNHPAMKKHLEVFLNVTLDSPYLRRKSIIHGVLDHHEFYNGKGYPNGKKGEEISLFGRILHIAHAYDSLVGGYDYTAGIAPLNAVKLVFENKDGMFDYNILNIFMYRTTIFKLGETMVLPNGKNGKIVGFENYVKNPHLPIVELKSGRTVNLLSESIPDA